MSAPAATAAPPDRGLQRLGRGVLICLLPVLVGLWAGATTFGGSMNPWRPVMVDLDVYLQAARVLSAGGDFYVLPGPLQFLYPPFAALLAVPLTLLPVPLVQIGWTAAGALMIVAMAHRFGFRGWPLSIVASGLVYLTGPVTQTLAFGQLGIVLVALVVLDLVPGPRALPGRRLLPAGVLTAVAAAIKLTPAIFVVYLFVVGRRRAAVTAIITGAALTLIAFVVLPGPSWQFWTRLAQGETGLGHSLIYYTNQSVYADVVRAFRLESPGSALGLALSAVVAGLGVWAAALWHRRGEIGMAVTLCGVASLLASPVSWLHHFVWVVPLALCLLELRRRRVPVAPDWFLVLGWVFIGWVLVSPYRVLPNGADLELLWTPDQHVLASVTAVLGVALLVGAIVLARRPAVPDPVPVAASAPPGSPLPGS